MRDGRSRPAVIAGRIGLLVVAAGTAWGAVSTAAGGHALGAVLVAAPEVAATNPPSTMPTPQIASRPAAPAPVSRARVRTPLPAPASRLTGSRRHVAR